MADRFAPTNSCPTTGAPPESTSDQLAAAPAAPERTSFQVAATNLTLCSLLRDATTRFAPQPQEIPNEGGLDIQRAALMAIIQEVLNDTSGDDFEFEDTLFETWEGQ